MQVKITVDDAATLDELRGLSVEAYMEAWAESISRFAQQRAREKLGDGFGGRIAKSIKLDVNGLTADIYPGGQDGYIGEHAHTGGPIESRNGKVLAIPSKWNDRRDLFASDRDDLIFIRSKARNRAYLFKEPEKGGKLGRPLYFLTPKTKPQKPRPWWPTDDEFAEATKQFFDDNF